jgi:hypothetical protein
MYPSSHPDVLYASNTRLEALPTPAMVSLPYSNWRTLEWGLGRGQESGVRGRCGAWGLGVGGWELGRGQESGVGGQGSFERRASSFQPAAVSRSVVGARLIAPVRPIRVRRYCAGRERGGFNAWCEL